MNPIPMHHRALEAFDERLAAVSDDQWAAPTPCTEWDLRTLVNHVVAGTFWEAPLLAGKRIEEVTGLDGDVLGDHPVAAFQAAADQARAAFDQPGASEATVHASFGDIPGEEYAWQRLFDILLHTWDVAVSTGGDTRLPPDLVEAVAGWFDGVEETARKAGAVAESVPVPPDADPRTRLLARCGRRS